MDKKEQKSILIATKSLFEQKGISKDETEAYLEEVFVKAFERDGKTTFDDDIQEAKIKAKVSLDEGIIEVKRIWEIVDSVDEENKLVHLDINSELLKDKNFKVGDIFIEDIDLKNVSYGKAQYIKQLLVQKIREAEKLKLYEQFKDKKGELVKARVSRKAEKFSILEYDGVLIFMPLSDHLPNDNFKIGDLIWVFVIEIDKISKDAQIVGSRTNPNFVRKLIEKEIEDIMDGVVKIEGIAREAGVKTKISVSSKFKEVDPVGSLIGIKGKKIAPIIEELKGERIDVVKYNNDIKKYVAEALLPANITGIFIKSLPNDEEETKPEIIAILAQDQFLAALGKRGINVMLAAKLTRAKIDIKTIEEAERDGIEWEKVERDILSNQKKYSKINRENIQENFGIEDMDLDKLAQEELDDENTLEDYENFLDKNDKEGNK